MKLILPNIRLPTDCSTSTTMGGMNGKGKKCIFPFVYQNITYTKCTKNDARTGKHWCSTFVDSNQHHVEENGYWGICLDECLIEGILI